VAARGEGPGSYEISRSTSNDSLGSAGRRVHLPLAQNVRRLAGVHFVSMDALAR
jgi:hypothetical protein